MGGSILVESRYTYGRSPKRTATAEVGTLAFRVTARQSVCQRKSTKLRGVAVWPDQMATRHLLQ